MNNFVEMVQALQNTEEFRAAGIGPVSRQRIIMLLGGLRELTATAVEEGGRMSDITDEAVAASIALLDPRSADDDRGLSSSVPRRTVHWYIDVPRRGFDMAEATTDPVRLPPGPRIPKAVMGVAFFTARHRAVAAVGKRFGSTFTIDLPIFGETVVVSDRALVKELFTAKATWWRGPRTSATVLGPGSTFSLDGDEHRERRKLLVPPFHGKRMVGYEAIVEEEVMREIAGWPEGREFETLEPMMRITLNAILRAVFGAQGSAFDELRQLLPPMVPLASRMAVMPPALRKDLGPWSPWGRVQHSRRRYDEIIEALIAEARSDPAIRGPQRRARADAARRVTRTARRSRTATSPTSC